VGAGASRGTNGSLTRSSRNLCSPRRTRTSTRWRPCGLHRRRQSGQPLHRVSNPATIHRLSEVFVGLQPSAPTSHRFDRQASTRKQGRLICPNYQLTPNRHIRNTTCENSPISPPRNGRQIVIDGGKAASNVAVEGTERQAAMVESASVASTTATRTTTPSRAAQV